MPPNSLPTALAINHLGQTYQTGHLDSYSFAYQTPALPATAQLDAKPSVNTQINVEFSHHCFSYEIEKSLAQCTQCGPSRDIRCFCPTRWEASLRLPKLFEGQLTSHSHHITKRKKPFYFTEIKQLQRGTMRYFVLFSVMPFESSAGKPTTHLRLEVQSAHYRKSPPLDVGRINFTTVVLHALRM
jgi:hypothetical protein